MNPRGWWRRLRARLRPLRSLGESGERYASAYLRRAGYRVLERNVRAGRDEADIIAIDPDGRTLVIVEVKTRRDDRVPPEAHVDRTKQHHLSRLAGRLLNRPEHRDRPVRFDVIGIVWADDAEPTLRHHQAAFHATY